MMNWHKIIKTLPDFWLDDRRKGPVTCDRCKCELPKEGCLRLFHGHDSKGTYYELCESCSNLYDKEYLKFREYFIKYSPLPQKSCCICSLKLILKPHPFESHKYICETCFNQYEDDVKSFKESYLRVKQRR